MPRSGHVCFPPLAFVFFFFFPLTPPLLCGYPPFPVLAAASLPLVAGLYCVGRGFFFPLALFPPGSPIFGVGPGHFAEYDSVPYAIALG